MHVAILKRLLAVLLTVVLIHSGLFQSAIAATIETQTVVQTLDREAAVSRIQAQLSRDDVRKALEELGVSPVQAKARVSALTDAEVAKVDRELARLPAAGDGGWILLVIVLTVLVVLFATGKLRLY